jgi:hypothetical protein
MGSNARRGHAGENDLLHWRAGQPGPLEFAAGDHVHAGTEPAQEAQDVEVGGGLDGVVEMSVER